MLSIFKKIFGTAQSRLIRKYSRLVPKINAVEKTLQSLAPEEVQAKTEAFKARLQAGEKLDDLLVEAYAVVKNACRRLLGTEVHVSGYDQKWDMVPYDVQLLGGICMHHGSIAEMQTGEGKTLTAVMPLYLNALSGKPVHLVTVNDYLAERDCQWIGTVFRWLGLRVECITNQTPPHLKKDLYQADILYGTASEFGFDYLRDNSMAQSAEEQCQRGHFFAIVDEVDSILIDEARTPLIISGPANHSRQMYEDLKQQVADVVRQQRDLCNKFATDARKILEKYDLLEDEKETKKLAKQEEKEVQQALRKLWLVSKGNPCNKTLKRIKENPNLRAEVDKLDIYYHSDANKEEKLSALAELYLIVDEKASEYELTDLGIQYWTESQTESKTTDFTMLDLGDEYAKIDSILESSETEKLQKKSILLEEDAKRKERAHNLRQMLRAHLLMEKDVDYIIDEGKIVIIDENTGRPQPGRRFSDGLHQAIEAKEGVKIQGETQTYATITLQNYFRLYTKLAGMTGTAITEANELKEIYKLDVLVIPTSKKCIRVDADDEIYMTEREKYNAILAEIIKIHKEDRPILIGTESVEISEKLSRILRQHKVPHTVLNARNHAQEAEIIAQAGKPGVITLATNMAGRGTDIKLKEGVAAKGGLHVIGTTRHQSRRIDRQLRGRGARQGDPGTSKFYISFEDSLMRLFTSSPRITFFLKKFQPPEGEPMSAKVLNKSIETAQKRVEARNYTIRKHTLEYDDVMNKQRTEIYAFRNEVLKTENIFSLAEEIIEQACIEASSNYLISPSVEGGWNLEGYRHWLITHFPVSFDSKTFENAYLTQEEIEQLAFQTVIKAFQSKLKHEQALIEKLQSSPGSIDSKKVLEEVICSLILRTIDARWQEHLLHIDHLRTEVSVRSLGQKDPLLEFKHEAFIMFDRLSSEIKVEIAHAFFKFEMTLPEPSLSQIQTIDLPNSKAKGKKLPRKPSPMIDLSMLNLDGP